MEGRFDPTKYETVKQRKDRLAADHATHVILAVPRVVTGEEAWFTVGMWRERAAMEVGAERLARAVEMGTAVSPEVALLIMAPDSIGTAYEAKWMSGASKTSWTENAEESAIGRCLDNAGYHSGGKCSREEILKAKEAEAALTATPKAPQENPFADGEIDLVELASRPRARAFLESWKGKKGVTDWRDCFHRAFGTLGWPEDRFFAWALEKGVDLANGAKYSDAVKLSALLLREVA